MSEQAVFIGIVVFGVILLIWTYIKTQYYRDPLWWYRRQIKQHYQKGVCVLHQLELTKGLAKFELRRDNYSDYYHQYTCPQCKAPYVKYGNNPRIYYKDGFEGFRMKLWQLDDSCKHDMSVWSIGTHAPTESDWADKNRMAKKYQVIRQIFKAVPKLSLYYDPENKKQESIPIDHVVYSTEWIEPRELVNQLCYIHDINAISDLQLTVDDLYLPSFKDKISTKI